MKEIMAKESTRTDQGVPSFEYNPADKRQAFLFEFTRPLEDLKKMLPKDFAGRRLTVGEIYEQHNVDRPYIRRNYKDALRQLEAEGKIKADPQASKRQKRLGEVTLADRVVIAFPKS